MDVLIHTQVGQCERFAFILAAATPREFFTLPSCYFFTGDEIFNYFTLVSKSNAF